MSKLLFNEKPLVVDVELATLIGLHQAIVLQQIHYWMDINRKRNNNFHDGRFWTYNTIKDWEREFPFWSNSTVKRIITELKSMKLLITGNYNKLKFDQTKWYSINYNELELLKTTQYMEKNTINEIEKDNKLPQNVDKSDWVNLTQCNGSNWSNDWVNLTQPIPEISTEINNRDLTDCPEIEIEQKIEQIETDKSETNNKISTNNKFASTKSGDLSKSETNNDKEQQYTITYLKEIYSYDQIIGHYDSNVVDEVLSEILNSINKSGKKLKICGSRKEKTEKFESIDVFTSRILKFNKNNIVNIVKKVLEEMKEHEITHVDLFVRTLCINESSSYIKDKTRGKKQKELNTQNTEYKVPQELNYEQRVYTDEQVDGYCENYWDKYPK